VDQSLLHQLDEDFHQLLEENGGDAKRAFAEACLANLGYEPSEDSDGGAQMMFIDEGDVSAVSTTKDP
jgi:hypothetical protein